MPFCAPQIVYSNSWLAKTSAISSTTQSLRPSSEGLFRISAGIIVTAGTIGSSTASLALQPCHLGRG